MTSTQDACLVRIASASEAASSITRSDARAAAEAASVNWGEAAAATAPVANARIDLRSRLGSPELVVDAGMYRPRLWRRSRANHTARERRPGDRANSSGPPATRSQGFDWRTTGGAPASLAGGAAFGGAAEPGAGTGAGVSTGTKGR